MHNIHQSATILIIVGPKGQRFVFCRLPNGYINSSSHLQSLISKSIQHIPDTIIYADDIMIASPAGTTKAQHLQKIETVIKALIDARLKVTTTNLLTKQYRLSIFTRYLLV